MLLIDESMIYKLFVFLFIEPAEKIKLYYYDDAVYGSRRMPNLSHILEGKTLITDNNATFQKDSGGLVLMIGSEKVTIGTDLIYVVDV